MDWALNNLQRLICHKNQTNYFDESSLSNILPRTAPQEIFFFRVLSKYFRKTFVFIKTKVNEHLCSEPKGLLEFVANHGVQSGVGRYDAA